MESLYDLIAHDLLMPAVTVICALIGIRSAVAPTENQIRRNMISSKYEEIYQCFFEYQFSNGDIKKKQRLLVALQTSTLFLTKKGETTVFLLMEKIENDAPQKEISALFGMLHELFRKEFKPFKHTFAKRKMRR